MSIPVIRGVGLTRIYAVADPPVIALDEVDIDVREGELVAIVGPSGSGKSTLMGVLGLLDRPTSGSLDLLGRSTDALADRERTAYRRDALGFVFQRFHLVGHLTARQNVEVGLMFRGIDGATRRTMADSALTRVGLGHRGLHRPGHLSGGEQQRVAIARAVASEPRVLLADEPTGNLDRAAATSVMKLFREFAAAGTAVIVATHDPEVVRQCTRTFAMRDGRRWDGA